MTARLAEKMAPILRPETLLFVGTLLAVMLGFAVLVRVRATYRFDLAATLAFQRFETPWATRLSRWGTWMGNSLTIVVLTVLIGGWWLWRGLEEAAVILAGSLLSLPINALLKNIVDRERPGENDLGVKTHGGPRWSYSYPSGHAMGSAAFYGTLATLVYMSFPSEMVKYLAVAILAFLPVWIGFSRIYLGAHWLSDIVGGWAGGIMFAMAAAAIFRP